LLVGIAALTYVTIFGLPNAAGDALPGAGDPIVLPSPDHPDGMAVNALGQDRTIGSMVTIYDDALRSGWETAMGDVKTEEAADPNGTGKSMRFDGAEIRFVHEPFDSAPYDRLTMKVHGGESGGRTLRITGLLRGKERSHVAVPALPRDTWQTVTVPLKDLGVDRKFTMTGFVVRVTSEPDGGTRLDDIRLLTPKDTE
ncbi:MAG: hypothetical protein SFU56_18850, partial [Capsulimonadales bacterium]|nr:hypothetical protein [Capsulimonadales bacterium]